MLKKIGFIGFSLLFVFALSLNSCTNTSNNENENEKKDSIENEVDKVNTEEENTEVNTEVESDNTQTVVENTKYICPNKCSGSDEPGTCSECGMEYIENVDYQE